jgi:hypothetical protein
MLDQIMLVDPYSLGSTTLPLPRRCQWHEGRSGRSQIWEGEDS